MTVHLRRSSVELLYNNSAFDNTCKDSISLSRRFFVQVKQGLFFYAACISSVGDVATAGCWRSNKAPIVHSHEPQEGETQAAPSCDLYLQNRDTTALTQQPLSNFATGVSKLSLNYQDGEYKTTLQHLVTLTENLSFPLLT